MSKGSHELLPPTELPSPEIMPPSKLPERGDEQRPVTEVGGSRATELTPVSVPLPKPTLVTDHSSPSPAVQLADPTTSPLAAPHTVAASAPPIADDNELIEKEWVLKAKAIVARTKTDPHEQNKELNHYKADYIKKRFNRDIKVTET